MENYGVILFYTASSAMRAEKMLKKNGLAIRLIPTPRELSSDCGVALRFNWDQAGLIRALLDSANVEIAGIHPFKKGGSAR